MACFECKGCVQRNLCFKLCIIMKRFSRLVISVISYGSSEVFVNNIFFSFLFSFFYVLIIINIILLLFLIMHLMYIYIFYIIFM